MAGEVAVAVFPLNSRLRESTTIPAGFKFNRAIAAVARVNDFMANSTIIGTSPGCHEWAWFPITYSCTVHRIHPLSLWILIIKRPSPYGTRPYLNISYKEYNCKIIHCQYISVEKECSDKQRPLTIKGFLRRCRAGNLVLV